MKYFIYGAVLGLSAFVLNPSNNFVELLNPPVVPTQFAEYNVDAPTHSNLIPTTDQMRATITTLEEASV